MRRLLTGTDATCRHGHSGHRCDQGCVSLPLSCLRITNISYEHIPHVADLRFVHVALRFQLPPVAFSLPLSCRSWVGTALADECRRAMGFHKARMGYVDMDSTRGTGVIGRAGLFGDRFAGRARARRKAFRTPHLLGHMRGKASGARSRHRLVVPPWPFRFSTSLACVGSAFRLPRVVVSLADTLCHELPRFVGNPWCEYT